MSAAATNRHPIIAAVVTLAVFAVAAGAWYALSPRMAIEALRDFDAAPGDIAARYDRAAVRGGFARQMLPQVDTYPPPLTKDVVLDAMSDPRSVRMFMAEPFGEWQFAAAEGLPPGLSDDGESSDPMPRLLEVTEDWWIERDGLAGFTASGADRSPSNTYRFRRDGLSWILEHIELTTEIR